MPRSFDEVFATEFESLHAYLRRRLGAMGAEDIAAETFAIAYRRWDELDPTRPVRPWLYGVATNLLRHHWRKEQRMLHAYGRTAWDPGLSEDEAPIDRLDAQARTRLLAEALAGLRARERDVLLLHAWAQLRDAEIAEALSLPIGTVKSRLSRGREHLRNRLRANGQSELNKLTTSEEIQ